MCCGLNLINIPYFLKTVGKSTQPVSHCKASSLWEVQRLCLIGRGNVRCVPRGRKSQSREEAQETEPQSASVCAHHTETYTRQCLVRQNAKSPRVCLTPRNCPAPYEHCLITTSMARLSTLPTIDEEMKLFRSNYKAVFQLEQMNRAQPQHVNAIGLGHSMKK